MRKRLYNLKSIASQLLILVALVAIMRLTEGAGFVVVIPLALLALIQGRPGKLFFYMFISGAMVVCNSRLVLRGALFFMEQRVFVALLGFFVSMRAFGMRKSPLVTPFMALMFYVSFMIIPSVLGWCPIVSFLKLFLFIVVFFAYWSIANIVARHPRDNLAEVRSVVLTIAIFFLVGSVVLIPFPDLSQMSAEAFIQNPGMSSLFMGMTNHSQCLGPMVAGLSTIIFADFLFGVRKMDKLYVFLLLCSPVLIWKTSSRTAMGTYLGGIMFATYFFMRARWVGHRWKGRMMSILWGVSLFLLIGVMLSSSMRSKAIRFLQKRGDRDAAVSVENVVSSRMGLVEVSLANFKKSPLIGNGFQVSEDMTALQGAPITSLLSAPIEKGVWITAILEEGGVIGFTMFVAFLLYVLFKMVKYKAYISASTFFVFILSNLGEFSFFSTSYLGGFMWMLVFAAVMLDSTRKKAEANERGRQMMMQLSAAQQFGMPMR